jgi:CRISPR-associated endonuclease/helicase Cas3
MKIDNVKIFAKSESKKEEDNLLSEHIKTCLINFNNLLNSLNYYPNYKERYKEEILRDAFFAITFHDLGKMEYTFQKQIYEKIYKNGITNKEIEEKINELKQLFGIKNDKNLVPLSHEVISVVYLDFIEQLLHGDSLPFNIRRVKTAILLHHYNQFYSKSSKLDMEDELDDYIQHNLDQYNNVLEFFKKNKKNILNNLKEIAENIANKMKEQQTNRFLLDMKNLIDNLQNSEWNFKRRVIRLADIKENQETFKLVLGLLMRIDYLSSFSQREGIQLSVEIVPKNFGKSEKISDIIKNSIEKNLKEKRGIQKLWQEELINYRNLANNNKRDICLTAPTGAGKTEFAFLLNDDRKLLYTLPLRAALNDLYKNRFLEYFGKGYCGLLHSTNFIEFENFYRGIKEVELIEKVNASKFLSYPFTLLTADQLMLCSLGFHGHERILTVIPYSHIVVDEIQAYNPEMLSIILSSLKLFKNLGAKVTIITATLPEFIKNELKEYFEFIDAIDVQKEIKEDIKNLKIKRHKIKILETNEKDEINCFKNVLDEVTKNNPKMVLVVFNTVKKAIEFYKKIEKEYREYEKILLHSRILEKEKTERIKKIKEYENDKESNKKAIIVTTQVIEASVDIDANVILSEISSIDSLIQRFGRVYRNNKSRDYNGSNPNCYIIAPILRESSEIIPIEKSSIYNETVLRKTFEVLKNIKEGEILSYEKEKQLVEKVYKDESILEYYTEQIKKFSEWVKYFTCEKKEDAQRIFRNIMTVEVCLWNELEEEVKQYLEGKDLDDNSHIDKFEIKKNIIENSFSIPLFKYKELSNFLSAYKKTTKRFKNIIFIEIKENKKLKEIKEYGIEGMDEIRKEISEKEYISYHE